MKKIIPILLSGGTGTRLWPLSRKTYPKQFSNLVGEKSLFQQSALRLLSSDIVKFSSHITITNSNFRFIVGDQLQTVGIKPGPILLEPVGKNTAPTILVASLFAHSKDSESTLLVAPSDHVIQDTRAFHQAVLCGIEGVKKGKIVTFGIKPTSAETGYGYLEISTERVNKAYHVKNFVEKPSVKGAEDMLKTGRYLWNAGIFLFRAADMINAFETYAPKIIGPVKEALSNSSKDLDFLRLEHEAWAKCEEISIDYAIMENAKNIVAIPFNGGWSDVGDWDAVSREMEQSQHGVVTSKNATAFDCYNTLLRSESSQLELVGLGLKNIIAVAMPDAVLVMHKDHSQKVKNLVPKLKRKNILQAEKFPKEYRPWGWFESLALHGRFQVKRIFVKAGAALSLQSHHHRSEHWIVVVGTAKIIIDNTVKLASEGESVYIPLGAVHRLENPGKIAMELIEVQTGAYLGEDDIKRYEDLYSRIET